jgi:hypothetical protein
VRTAVRDAGRSPSSTAIVNSDSAPITVMQSGMSGMPWREIKQKNGVDPTTRTASHATRRLTRDASIHHTSTRPSTAHAMNGRRIASIVRPPSSSSPE